MNTVPHGIDANYRLTIRKFPSVVEVTVKPVNHQLALAGVRSHGLKRPSQEPDLLAIELTETEQQEQERKKEENRTRSIRRAKQAVRWLVHRIEADHLLTLHYRENMEDVEKLKSDFDHFRRLMLAKYPEWKYVAAREFQQRGAYHLHLAVKGRQDVKYIRTCWYKVLGCLGATGDQVLGNIDVQAPNKRFGQPKGIWKPSKLALYLTKYIDKGFDLAEHSSKKYWSSKGTAKPVVVRHWLGSQNIVEMIKDSFDIAMLHGMVDFPDQIMQSQDRTVLWLSGARNLKLQFG